MACCIWAGIAWAEISFRSNYEELASNIRNIRKPTTTSWAVKTHTLITLGSGVSTTHLEKKNKVWLYITNKNADLVETGVGGGTFFIRLDWICVVV